MENNKRGNEIFLGVIGVATLVVAIIGATFAYFSARTGSNENAVAVNSATVSLNYSDDVTLMKSNLIPSSEAVATYAALVQDSTTRQETEAGSGIYKNDVCTDDNANEVCGIYEFTVTNPTSTQQSLSYQLEVMVNEFTNLSYKIYDGEKDDLTQASTPVVSTAIFPAADALTGNPIELTALNTSLAVSGSKTYTMVIWLNETGEDQSNDNATQGETAQDGSTNEAGKAFAATMTVTSGDGSGGVSGEIRAIQQQGGGGSEEPHEP